MADVAPDLAADLLAAFSSVHEDKVEAVTTARESEAVEPTASPPKRPRTTEHEAEGCAGKRQKTEHGLPADLAPDPGAPSWDISAMIQNALGSLDRQLDPRTQAADHGDGAPQTTQPPLTTTADAAATAIATATASATATPTPTPTPHTTATAAPAATSTATTGARKPEQRRMKFSSNPYYVMRTMSLPLLGSLAVQILLALSQQSRQETLALIADQESEYRKAYDLLKNVLEHARRIFSESSPLLFADDLEVSDSEDRETLRMLNLAVISSSVLQGGDELLPDGHENFATIFIPEDGELASNAANLCISLKTQAFLKSLQQIDNTQGRSDALDAYFPANTDDAVSRSLGDAPSRTQEKKNLASGLGIRRHELLESVLDDEKRLRLAELYPFESLVDDLSSYLQSQLGAIVEYAEKYGVNIPISDDLAVNELLENGPPETDHDELSLLLQSATSDLVSNGAENPGDTDPGSNMNGDSASLTDSLGLGKLIQDSLLTQHGSTKEGLPDNTATNGVEPFDSEGLASLIASKLNNAQGSVSNGGPSFSSQPYHPTLPPSSSAAVHSPSLAQLNQLSQTPYYSYTQQPPPLPQPPAERGTLPPNQTFPTSILYERARQAAVAKSSSTARREGLHSTRRAWTPEEEKALMAGLDMVKGPHWSQILTIFGQNGTISDILKDRTQVQLKDKARNLKLFFLKTNSEMPYYLQCVTGELKTRAPSQAARKEAEEKARLNSEEEQARLQGIPMNAQGLHSNRRNTHSPVPISGTSTSTRASPVTPGIGVGSGYAATAASPVRNTPIAAATSPNVKSEPPDGLPVYQSRVERPDLPRPHHAVQKPVQQPPVLQLAQQPVYQPKLEPPEQPAASQLRTERPAQPAMQIPETRAADQSGMEAAKTEPQVVTAGQPLPQSTVQAPSQQLSQSHVHPVSTQSSPPPVPHNPLDTSRETTATKTQSPQTSITAPPS